MSQLDRATAVYDELVEASDALKASRQKTATVHLGLGYFAQMANEDAIKTVERQIARAKQSLVQVRELNGLSEEGLPIMEILEMLDESGNVIESSVQSTNSSLPTIQSALRSLDAKRRSAEARESDSASVELSESFQTAKIVEVDSTPAENVETTTGPAETTRAENGAETTAEALSDSAGKSSNAPARDPEIENSTPLSTYNGLTDEDLLHLELSGSEFEEEDFEDDDGSESESDSETVNASLFPQTSKVSQRLAEELAKQRIKVKQAKSVQFNQKLDVVEFNTQEPPSATEEPAANQAQLQSSDLQKKAMQYFEQAFIEDDQFLQLHRNEAQSAETAIAAETKEPDTTKREEREILSDIAERTAQSASFAPADDVVEDRQLRAEYHSKRRSLIQKAGGYKITEAEQATEPVAPPKQKVSRFKAARLASMT